MVRPIFEAEKISHVIIHDYGVRICIDQQLLIFGVVDNKIVRMTESEFFDYTNKNRIQDE